jgi:hypothetical protein
VIDFATVEAALKALVSTLSSDSAPARIPSRLEDEPEEQLSDLVRAEITIMRGVFVTVGATDERRAVYSEGEDALIETICSLRRGSWRIKCTALEQTSSENAWHVIERVRTRLSRRSARETLRAVNVAVIEATPTIDLSRANDQKQASIAAFDLRVQVMIAEEDPTRLSYIETIGIGGTLQPGDIVIPPTTITGEQEP